MTDTDFSRLSRSWLDWSTLIGMTNVSVSTDCSDALIGFLSDDGSFYLRQDGSWWVVDEVDDRGRRRNGTGRFSTFELTEKYLIWTWASVARTAIGVPQLGAHLNSLGMAPLVQTTPTEREYVTVLTAHTGSAELPLSKATIFSHLMLMSLDEIDSRVKEGVSG